MADTRYYLLATALIWRPLIASAFVIQLKKAEANRIALHIKYHLHVIKQSTKYIWSLCTLAGTCNSTHI